MTRYAMITGASSGLGLALAEALARRGRNLILVARQRETLEPVAIELTQRFGVEVLFRACDLGEPLRLSGFLLELEEGQWHVDLLVNNAVANITNYTVWFAITFWVYIETQSVFATGTIAGLYLVFTAAFGIWLGSIVDVRQMIVMTSQIALVRLLHKG